MHFPREWHEPVARVCDGGPASLLERQLTKRVALSPVARVAGRPKTLTLDELVQETDVSRFVIKAILTEGGVVPRRQRRSSRGILLFDAKDARDALEAAFGPEGHWDRLAYAGSPLQVSEAARRAGVSVAELRAAGAAGDLAVHRTRNGSMRFQRVDVDGWRANRRAGRPGTGGW